MLVCSRKMEAKKVPANEVGYIFNFQQLFPGALVLPGTISTCGADIGVRRN